MKLGQFKRKPEITFRASPASSNASHSVMQHTVNIHYVDLSPKFPGIRNECSKLPPHHVDYDDNDYSQILEGVKRLLAAQSKVAVAIGGEPPKSVRMYVRTQHSNFGKRFMTMMAGKYK